MHFGDRVPAEYASVRHDVMNSNGVVIDTVDGQKTAEQVAEEQRIAAEEAMR